MKHGNKSNCCMRNMRIISNAYCKRKLILLLCFILLGGITAAQDVVRNGNTFTAVSKKKQKEAFKATPYAYVASDGTKYPIYISGNGKYFIIRKSAKTGKEYRHYLPKVQEQLEQNKPY